MSGLEEVTLVPETGGNPACRCGAEMQLAEVHLDEEAEKRIFRCPACPHRLKLMVWKTQGNL